MAGMATFSATTESTAVVAAPRARIWEALTDPELLPRLTPFLEAITADGDRWCWQMTRLPVVGLDVVPAFTERMRFTEPERIDFSHAPPPGKKERTGVDGWYVLTEQGPDRTHLAIRLTVTIELPVSRLASPAVTSAMKGVMATMGKRFAANLTHHVGAGRA
jgi:carbon monoxide dehydrogenase subunit G